MALLMKHAHMSICVDMRKAFVASGLALVVLASACGSNGSNADEATLELRAAVEHTMTAGSFHVGSVQMLEGTESSMETDYVSPDRFYSRGLGRARVTTILIGRDRYISEPEDIAEPEEVKRFFEAELPCAMTLEKGYLVPSLASLREVEDVSHLGGTYSFNIDAFAEGAWGTAQIEGGRLVSLSLHFTAPAYGGEPVDERYIFSGYGAPRPIESPPPDRIVNDDRFGELPILNLNGHALPCR
jgi:hypothetical protein